MFMYLKSSSRGLLKKGRDYTDPVYERVGKEEGGEEVKKVSNLPKSDDYKHNDHIFPTLWETPILPNLIAELSLVEHTNNTLHSFIHHSFTLQIFIETNLYLRHCCNTVDVVLKKRKTLALKHTILS